MDCNAEGLVVIAWKGPTQAGLEWREGKFEGRPVVMEWQ